MHLTTLILTASISVPPPGNPFNEAGRLLLDSIRRVESGSVLHPECATGDRGASIGPYQIKRCCWSDAIAYDPSIGGTYADCRNAEYAERIVIAYWSRYAPDWRPETLARIWNGGPRGYRNYKTVNYWHRVQAAMR